MHQAHNIALEKVDLDMELLKPFVPVTLSKNLRDPGKPVAQGPSTKDRSKKSPDNTKGGKKKQK